MGAAAGKRGGFHCLSAAAASACVWHSTACCVGAVLQLSRAAWVLRAGTAAGPADARSHSWSHLGRFIAFPPVLCPQVELAAFGSDLIALQEVTVDK